MGLLTREQLQSIQLRNKDVDLTSYGVNGTVRVRALTAAEERDIYQETETLGEQESNIAIAFKAAIDANGSPLLTRELAEQMPGMAVRKIATTCLVLSGMMTEKEASEADKGKLPSEAAG